MPTEQECRLGEEGFRALVESHPRGIMLATTEPRIVYINRKFEEVTGYRPEEVVGQPPSILSSGLHSRDFYQSMWQSLQHQGHWDGLIWNRRKTGETYPQWLSIYRVSMGNEAFYAGMFMEVGDLAAIDERLACLAYYDPLTELPNRALFVEFLNARVGQRYPASPGFAVMFIDLDFFKSVNDLHGHEFGDTVLRMAAGRIQTALRRRDVVARLSGDEFAAIVELDSADDLAPLCERMVAAFREPLMVEQKELFLSVSVGAALYPEHGDDGLELVQHADQAMYMAKQAGRSCFRLFCPTDREQGLQQQRLYEALVTSVNTAPEQFRVEYQPQYLLSDGRITAMEALLRWRHPEFGEVSPAEFMPVAEARGHTHELSECLVYAILRDLPRSPPPGWPVGLGLAVNISARQVTDTRLTGLLEPLLERLRTLGWHLEIEITETHIMNLSPPSLQRLEMLRQKGVVIAMDDFGTGYSSLACLQALPVQVLKIDRQFVRHLGNQHQDARVVAAILGIAEALELEVVAEGIEEPGQYRQLCELGCLRGQGYLMARPVPWDKLQKDLIDGRQFRGGF